MAESSKELFTLLDPLGGQSRLVPVPPSRYYRGKILLLESIEYRDFGTCRCLGLCTVIEFLDTSDAEQPEARGDHDKKYPQGVWVQLGDLSKLFLRVVGMGCGLGIEWV